VSACPKCLRRAWLLGELNGRLEYRGRAVERLISLLELSDEQLTRAVAGADTRRLLREHAEFDPDIALAEGIECVCCHDRRYPRALLEGAGMPSVLHVAGGLDRLRLLEEPTVAIVGTRAASDYGMEVAHGLARGLAASGVTVVGGLAEGIAAAALEGALDAKGSNVTVAAGGVDVCHPARRRTLAMRLRETGCTLAELPCGARPRSWCHTARARIVVGLAHVVIVVEARDRTGELLHAQLARSAGRCLAAVPGRVGSPLARGPHMLLRDGALLVRDARDVLDALYGVQSRPMPQQSPELAPRQAPLDADLESVLDHVGAGRDTLAKLLAAGCAEDETLVALAALELDGALVRGDAGRYVRCL
jgi:DNA processing protein